MPPPPNIQKLIIYFIQIPLENKVQFKVGTTS